MAKKTKDTSIYWTSGRRKTAVARIRLTEGTGVITVNDREFIQYFPEESDRKKILAPFKEAGLSENGFDVSMLTSGGGIKAQVDAAMLGVAKALVKFNEDTRKLLRKKSLLTRDPRMKERKKIGLHKARRAHQFSKR